MSNLFYFFSKNNESTLNLLYISFSMIFISVCISSLHLCSMKATDVIKKTTKNKIKDNLSNRKAVVPPHRLGLLYYMESSGGRATAGN